VKSSVIYTPNAYKVTCNSIPFPYDIPWFQIDGISYFNTTVMSLILVFTIYMIFYAITLCLYALPRRAPSLLVCANHRLEETFYCRDLLRIC
jgi:hypothetical protein